MDDGDGLITSLDVMSAAWSTRSFRRGPEKWGWRLLMGSSSRATSTTPASSISLACHAALSGLWCDTPMGRLVSDWIRL
jgi:hypothetical protein